jgi:signal transduction histidine kinase/ligand-binding sensor domain-containing protein/DNA-binding response OmpR family regulator
MGMFFCSLHPLAQNLKFKHLTGNNGLVNTAIQCIIQDIDGVIWIGTEDGLHRYDGYDFKVYQNIDGDTTSLTANFIQGIIQDKDQDLWIATNFGVDLFNRNDESFTHIPLDCRTIIGSQQIYGRYFVNNIYEDHAGNIFLGTEGPILFKLDKSSKCFKPFAPQLTFNKNNVKASDRNGNIWITSDEGAYKLNVNTLKCEHFQQSESNLLSDKVICVFVDSNQNVWIASDKGLNKIDGLTQKMQAYTSEYFNPTSSSKYLINQIYEDIDNRLWFCTENGLYRFNVVNDSFVRYANNPMDDNSLNGNRVCCAYLDKQSVLWIGIEAMGVDYTPLADNYNFESSRISQVLSGGFDCNVVSSILADNAGNIWMGTDGGGLCRYNPDADKYEFFRNKPSDKKTIGTNSVLALFQDSRGDIWAGGYFGGGLNKLNLSNGTFTTYQLAQNDPLKGTTGANDVRAIIEDDHGNLIVATNGDGVYLFDCSNKKAKAVLRDPQDYNSLCSNYCTVIYKDSRGAIWIGTYDGLSRWEIDKNRFTTFRRKDGDPKSLVSNVVFSLVEDHEKNMWIGTNNGLCRFNEKSNDFTIFSSQDGLPNNVINAILTDDNKNLWLSTNHGISKFNLSSQTFKNFNADCGLQGNQFFHGSYFKGHSGELFFGGMNGMTRFHPDKVKENEFIPPVYITEFQLFNKIVTPGDETALLNQHISKTKLIVLNYDQSFISFKYLALDYMNASQITYSYMLEGFDKKWHDMKNERMATYTNLSPGSYVFRVKACNSDGRWNEQGASVQLIVKPPFWKTWWAYVFYLVVIAGLFSAIMMFLRYQDELKQKIEIQRIEAEKQHHLDMLKIRFLTNISHEFRTPLTLILAPTQRLIQNLQANVHSNLPLAETIWRNSQRLLTLINQLLDYRKIDAGSEALQIVDGDIVHFVFDIMKLFDYQAEQRNVKLSCSAHPQSITACFDPAKMEKVISNLLSNALKFTPAGGAVSIHVSLESGNNPLFGNFHHSVKQMVKIEVSDTGKGIPDSEKNQIFNPFYQVQDNALRKQQGSGIGLALVLEYMRMHKGSVLVKDNSQYHTQYNEGSTFIAYWPVGDIYSSKMTSINESQPIGLGREYYIENQASTNPSTTSNDDAGSLENSELPSLLIVEDYADLRMFLKSELKHLFKVLEAADGREGLEIAVNQMPDLIISDVMMKEMSGIELCRHIKTDARTSHIPVILLTALSEDEYKIEGLETGADDYLTKPFNIDILTVRIRNLVDLRKQLQKKFSNSVSLNNRKLLSNVADQQFMDKIVAIVDRDMDNPNIDIEQLSRDVGMSRTQLYKKIKAISGQTVFELIYTIRLKKAAEILLNENVSVSEVSSRVGFSNLSVFTRSFTRHFNINPSKYAQVFSSQNQLPSN